MNKTLSYATTPGQSGPGNYDKKGVHHIHQSSDITGFSSLDCLVSYPRHSLQESYLSAEKQSMYSVVPADWAIGLFNADYSYLMENT